MDLATITCDRDFYIMDAQSKSIQKFLSPCKHWIFVLESEKPKQEWIDLLTPYYTKHEVEFIFLDYTPRVDPAGWAIQQYWKLRMVDWIKGDFVIIDTKNLFVRETNLNDWPHEGSGVFGYLPDDYLKPEDPGYDDTTNGVLECMRYYSEFYNIPPIKKFMTVITPFLARQDVMEEVSSMVKEKNVFAVKTGWHLDFLLYSMVAEKYGLLDTEPDNSYPGDCNSRSIYYHKTPWENNDLYKRGFSVLKEHPTHTCIGLHHSWIDYAPNDERDEMLNFLESHGILTENLKNKINLMRP